MQQEFNNPTIHLVTQYGGKFTPIEDVIYAKPKPWTEEFSRAKLGFFAGAKVLAKGAYSGGMTRESYDDVIKQCALIKLPNDQLAINPNIAFEIDTFDPIKDFANKENSTFLVHNGEGLEWSGRAPMRIEIQTPINDVLKLFPNIVQTVREGNQHPPATFDM